MPTELQIGILGTGSYVPERVLGNAELARITGLTNDWIIERTGIRERRIAAAGENTSAMAALAAKRACTMAGIPAEDIDIILVASVTGETHFPATACWVQDKLANRKAWVLDVTLGCAGFVYALAIARSVLRDNLGKSALVIGADRVSAIADYTDPKSCILFGDAAGAVVLGPVANSAGRGNGLLDTSLHCDGSKATLLFRPLDAVASPDNPRHASPGSPFMYMEGRVVYKHAVQCMESAVREVLASAQLPLADVAWIVPHQANARIVEALTVRLNADPRKVFTNIELYGNTSAATIPLCLDQMSRAGQLQVGNLILLCTFGTGFTWAAQLLRWTVAN